MACPFEFYEYYAELGDTSASIARKFSVNEKELKALNNFSAITQGTRLKIPCMGGGCGCGVFYTIKRGETLFRIAKKNKISMETLLKYNPYLNPSYYLPGQVIVLPYSKQALARYTLGKNERLADVIKRYGMDISTFCSLNPDIDPMGLKEGAKVRVKKDHSLGMRYTVEKGDTLVSVADRFGLRVSSLLAANRDFKPSEFRPGMVLRIPER